MLHLAHLGVRKVVKPERIFLDVKEELEGVERARLADVVICTCRPGVLEKIVMLLRVPYMSE